MHSLGSTDSLTRPSVVGTLPPPRAAAWVSGQHGRAGDPAASVLSALPPLSSESQCKASGREGRPPPRGRAVVASADPGLLPDK